MDEASQQPLGERSAHSSDDKPLKQAAEQEAPGPYIVGSPIDLGAIDNVDSVNLRLGPGTKRASASARRKARAAGGGGEQQHIELQEAHSPTTNLPGW